MFESINTSELGINLRHV